MKIWGCGIFENSLASDLREEFEALFAKGQNIYFIANLLLEKHEADLNDAYKGQALWFALAKLQMEHGAVSPQIRKHVLTLINSGEAFESWMHHSPDKSSKRQQVEQTLRNKLLEIG